MTASAVLFVLCLLVLFSNIIDRIHTNDVKKSISTLYEDRLIAEIYILDLTKDVYLIKEVLTCSESTVDEADKKMNSLLLNINRNSEGYGKTKFTKTEENKFDLLKKVFEQIADFKKDSLNVQLHHIEKALVLLGELSDIQLSESKLIMKQSEQLYNLSKLSSQFAFAVVIAILIVLQALVFSSKTLRITNSENPNLN